MIKANIIEVWAVALSGIAAPLLAWYRANARDLPWRENTDPYRVWVSEIMLQQTRVEAVKPYFARFMGALPTIRDLAEAPEDHLLKLWEGLGYYSRVRNLQKAAVILTEQYGGQMPADYAVIRSLPGIGSYTAGAIASIAFGLPRPAVDGNVLRVLSRYLESHEDVMRQSVRRGFEDALQTVIPREDPGSFTQALIELGALVCGPKGAPACEVCPLRETCRARAAGDAEDLPVRKAPKARRIEEKTVLVLVSENRAALRRRPPKGLLAGLYELPNLEGHLTREEALDYVKELGLSALRIQPLPEARHIFSHIEWHMAGYLVKLADPDVQEEPNKSPVPRKVPDKSPVFFVDKTELEGRYALPSAFAAYLTYFRDL